MTFVPVIVSPVPDLRLTPSPDAAETASVDPLSTRTEAVPAAIVTVSFDPTTSTCEFVSTPTVTFEPLTTLSGPNSPLPPTVTLVAPNRLTVKPVPVIVSPDPETSEITSPAVAEIASFEPDSVTSIDPDSVRFELAPIVAASDSDIPAAARIVALTLAPMTISLLSVPDTVEARVELPLIVTGPVPSAPMLPIDKVPPEIVVPPV